MYTKFFKRFLDIVLSGMAIVVLSPLLLLLAVLAVFIVRCVRRRRKQGSDRKHHRAQ